jgi:hypothetical protein
VEEGFATAIAVRPPLELSMGTRMSLSPIAAG